MLYNDAFDRATMNILTSFPFTFKLAVPGMSNPFSSLSTSPTTGTNPPRAPPAQQPNFSERQSRPLARPTRPLPMPLGSSPMMVPHLGRHPRPSFSPSPSPSPSTLLSLTHSYSHLAPESHLSPYQWQAQSQFLQTPPHSQSSSPAPHSLKRGWEPSYSSPSESQATLASSSGYFDAPAKYRDLVDKMEVMEVDQAHGMRELDEDDLPPTKRRRGLAGSIVSTAWSAALIGTAVGLTVYRLWRDRGRQDDERTGNYNGDSTHQRKRRAEVSHDIPSEPPSPPPPYNQEWTAIDHPQVAAQHTPRRDKGKSRVAPRSVKNKKTTTRIRWDHRQRPAAAPSSSAATPAANRPGFLQSPEFDFTRESNRSTQDIANNPPIDVDDVEDQMDWIGGKLAQLIEEGKKALGKEVVVMSEAKEDEVDDGLGAWESDEDDCGGKKRRSAGLSASLGRRESSASTTRFTSTAHSSRRSVGPPVSPAAQTPPRRTHVRGISYDTGIGFGGEHGGLEDTSPEVRKMMEHARARLAARTSARR